jgi:hypothetical protein
VIKPEKLPERPKVTIASFILSPSLRRGGVSVVKLPKDVTDAAFQLRMESNDYPEYRISLTAETGSSEIWRSGKLKITGNAKNSSLRVKIPAKLISSGIYTLAVSGIKDGNEEITANYTFRSEVK